MGLGVADRGGWRDPRDSNRAVERSDGAAGDCSGKTAGAPADHTVVRGDVYRRLRWAVRQVAAGLQLAPESAPHRWFNLQRPP